MPSPGARGKCRPYRGRRARTFTDRTVDATARTSTPPSPPRHIGSGTCRGPSSPKPRPDHLSFQPRRRSSQVSARSAAPATQPVRAATLSATTGGGASSTVADQEAPDRPQHAGDLGVDGGLVRGEVDDAFEMTTSTEVGVVHGSASSGRRGLDVRWPASRVGARPLPKHIGRQSTPRTPRVGPRPRRGSVEAGAGARSSTSAGMERRDQRPRSRGRGSALGTAPTAPDGTMRSAMAAASAPRTRPRAGALARDLAVAVAHQLWT